MLTQEDNLIIQTYCSVTLLAELRNNDFINSEFFEGMDFSLVGIKEAIRQIGIDNQGSALMALYAMLVLPREILKNRYETEYSGIQDFLIKHCINTTTNYPKDSPEVDYLRHIRNSVAHARAEFESNETVRFIDEDSRRGYSFATELSLQHF